MNMPLDIFQMLRQAGSVEIVVDNAEKPQAPISKTGSIPALTKIKGRKAVRRRVSSKTKLCRRSTSQNRMRKATSSRTNCRWEEDPANYISTSSKRNSTFNLMTPPQAKQPITIANMLPLGLHAAVALTTATEATAAAGAPSSCTTDANFQFGRPGMFHQDSKSMLSPPRMPQQNSGCISVADLESSTTAASANEPPRMPQRVPSITTLTMEKVANMSLSTSDAAADSHNRLNYSLPASSCTEDVDADDDAGASSSPSKLPPKAKSFFERELTANELNAVKSARIKQSSHELDAVKSARLNQRYNSAA